MLVGAGVLAMLIGMFLVSVVLSVTVRTFMLGMPEAIALPSVGTVNVSVKLRFSLGSMVGYCMSLIVSFPSHM